MAAAGRTRAAASVHYEGVPRQVPQIPDQPTPAVASEAPSDSADGEQRDLGSTWEAIAERLRGSVPEPTFRLWLEPLRAVAARGDTLYIKAPDGIRAWVQRRYAGLIAEAMAAAGTGLREVSFEAQPSLAPGGNERTLTLNPNYTFERFVIGEGNRLAHAAALAVAEAPAEAYNPLFLHGPPGLGKTHLLGAIANYLRESAPELQVRYTTAEAFTSEFVTALQASGAEAFKRRYRDLDVLLIDDIQFLEGKRHTEEEFFHTFNALYESGSQLVLSADRIPSELSSLAERLRDRFEWGLTLPVEPPNLAMRLVLLRRLVREAEVEIADGDALGVLARRIDANVRQLHGALTRVIAHASLRARPVTPELIEEVIPSSPGPRDDVEAIVDTVAARFELPAAELLGPSRAAAPLRARQLAIYLCRETTDLSLPQIGRRFGGRDHATVLNAIRRVEQRQSDGDTTVGHQLEELRVEIHNRRGAAA
jgi:chromosomal replication initiator protein